MRGLEILVLSFGLVIFIMSGFCLVMFYSRKRAINWSFDKDECVRASLNSSLWFIANMVLYSLVTVLTSTI